MPNQELSKQGKYWLFVINNYTTNNVLTIRSLVARNENVNYICVGFEVGDEAGTEHLQGYLQLAKKRRGNKVQELLQCKAHIELCKCDWAANYKYCSKTREKDNAPNEVFEVYGVPSKKGQGRRTDLEEIRVKIQKGTSMLDISTEHFGDYIRYHRGFVNYQFLCQEPRDFVTECHIYWGETGTGKTRKAYELAKPDVWFSNSSKLQWFDGYCGQENVIIDEFTGSTCDIKVLLQLLDRYPMRVAIKGGFAQWRPKKVFITSNINPSNWYNHAHPEHCAALMRRVTSVTHFNPPIGE